jgi:hypothetical protein
VNTEEARGVLARHLADYRARSYGELVELITAGPQVAEIHGPSGTPYQLEIIAVWDGSAGSVRVIGSIDDGGWRAFLPLTDSFMMRTDGSWGGDSSR